MGAAHSFVGAAHSFALVGSAALAVFPCSAVAVPEHGCDSGFGALVGTTARPAFAVPGLLLVGVLFRLATARM